MTFDELYRTYYSDVHRFALWLCREPSDADDVAAETFVRAWGRREGFRTETLRAYLLAIARSVRLDQLRKERRRAELPAEVVEGAPGPERRAEGREEWERVHRAIGELPEPERVALVLRAGQELPYAEIARVLGISEGAARLKVHRARRRLLAAQLDSRGEP